MEQDADRMHTEHQPSGITKTGLLLGLAAGVAGLVWATARQHRPLAERRFADRGLERRNPMHFFLAGNYPHRRAIDNSGRRPLFERRQSVYDAY
jgi:hypothetical protein